METIVRSPVFEHSADDCDPEKVRVRLEQRIKCAGLYDTSEQALLLACGRLQRGLHHANAMTRRAPLLHANTSTSTAAGVFAGHAPRPAESPLFQPYSIHPDRVGDDLVVARAPAEVVGTGLLHDTPEEHPELQRVRFADQVDALMGMLREEISSGEGRAVLQELEARGLIERVATDSVSLSKFDAGHKSDRRPFLERAGKRWQTAVVKCTDTTDNYKDALRAPTEKLGAKARDTMSYLIPHARQSLGQVPATCRPGYRDTLARTITMCEHVIRHTPDPKS